MRRVIETVSRWGTPENLMFVIGATQADEFTNIRKISPVISILYRALAHRAEA